MTTKEDRHRVPAVIESVEGPHREDHGMLTVNIAIKTVDEKGRDRYHQGFGGLCFGNGEKEGRAYAADYVATLCRTFDVKKFDDLVGKKCFALYSFGEHNEPIEGLESAETGMRFLNNVWRKKHWPETTSVFAQKANSIESTINWAERRLRDAKEDLLTIKTKYVDWEKK